MKILTVANVPPDPNSGAAGTVFHTNVALREMGHDVDAVWSDRLGPRRIGHGNLHSLLEQPRAYRREVLKAIAAEKYDAVMISQPQGYLAARALKQSGFGGAVVNRSHGLELRVDAVLPEWHRKLNVPESRNSWVSAILKPLLTRQWTQAVRWFDGIVVPSFDDRDFLRQSYGLPEGKVVTIHHGVPDSFLNTPVADMTAERRQRILYVGQYSFIKGPDILAAILNRILPANPQLEMTWVTAESAHPEIRFRLDSSILDRVKLLNWVPQEKLLPLYDDHGVFVFPSFFEGAGKACAEALSRGLYVVATNTGGMKDHLAAVGAAGLCPAGGVDAFAQAILRWTSGKLNTDMTKYVEYIRSKTWTACAQQLVKYFENCSARNSSGGLQRPALKKVSL